MKPSLDALFTAVYDDPRADGPRLVLADALVEVGDPRGEFISCQCAPHADETSKKRADVLLRKHRRAWLEPLLPVLAKLSGCEFSRGFPVAAELRVRKRDAAAAAARREWATFERIDFGHGLSFLSPSMRALRAVGPVDPSSIPLLLGGAGPWAIEQLELGGRGRFVLEARDFEALAQTALLPRLRKLILNGLADCSWAFSGTFGAQLETFDWHTPVTPQGLRGAWEGARSRSTLRVLNIVHPVWSTDWGLGFHFTTGEAPLDRLLFRCAPALRERNLEALLALPEDALTELTVEQQFGALRPVAPDFLEQLERAAGRFHRLRSLDLSRIGGRVGV